MFFPDRLRVLLRWFTLAMAASQGWACDLCAVYRAADARGDAGQGFVASVAEQFVPYRTAQLDGDSVTPAFAEHVDSSITHLVVGYNFTSRFGLSINAPFTRLQFVRRDLRYALNPPATSIVTEDSSTTGWGDASLIARGTVVQIREMQYGLVVNLLAGVKFPTGNDERLDDEIEQTKIFDTFPTPHSDPLSHSISSVHQHMLALGSGSFDGIFGATLGANWSRAFLNAQFQYYLRTEGESGFKYGNEWMISGGPGIFLLLSKSYSLSLAANAIYDVMDRDELLGRVSDRTGLTAWYCGPLVNITWGDHLSANAGVDIPLAIANHGFQSVPDYRFHAGVAWRF